MPVSTNCKKAWQPFKKKKKNKEALPQSQQKKPQRKLSPIRPLPLKGKDPKRFREHGITRPMEATVCQFR